MNHKDFHCFASQGGVSDEVTLSAYVTAALLETNISVSVSRVFQALMKKITIILCIRDNKFN